MKNNSKKVKKLRPKGYWNKELCQKEASRFRSRSEFHKKNMAAYAAAWKAGYLNDICKHMHTKNKPIRYWTKIKCREEAKKYSNRTKLHKNCSLAYNAARNNNWLDEICTHMKTPPSSIKKWFKKNCKVEARKYTSKAEFRKKCSGGYVAAYRGGFLDDICKHMVSSQKPTGFWTKENCLKVALKFSSRVEFQKNANGAYKAAWRKGFLDEICTHMTKLRNS